MASDVGVLNPPRPVTVERYGLRAGRGARVLAGVLAALVVAVGLGLRIWALGRAPMNSDEAVVGLMAREILHGHFFAFYWGQDYGGVEPYVTVVLFAVFGQSSITLSLTPMVLDLAAAVLIWRIGRRIYAPEVGLGAAVLFLVFPEVDLWQSTIEYGFRWAALVLGLGMLLLALRICEDSPSPRRRDSVLVDWILLGGCLGLGWWATPEIVYYAIPTGVLLGFHVVRRGLRPPPLEVAAAVAAAVAGALPWLWDNVGHGFPSLRHSPQGPGNAGFAHHLHVLGTKTLPMLLGLRLHTSGSWVFDAPVARVCYLLALVAGAAFLIWSAVRRRAVVVVVFAVVGPLVYAYSPFTWYWQDGRYALFLAPVVALVAVAAVHHAVGALALRRVPVTLRLEIRRLLGPALVVAAGLALTLAAIGRLDPYKPVAATGRTNWTWQSDPNSYLTPIAATVEQAGVTGVYAGYWLAYDLAFEAHGALVVSDVTSFARYRPYLTEAEAASRTAWLFTRPSTLPLIEAETGAPPSLLEPACVGGSACLEPGQLQRYLRSIGDPYRRIAAGELLAVLPQRPVAPAGVLAYARIKTG